jgi:hypothetical protein
MTPSVNAPHDSRPRGRALGRLQATDGPELVELGTNSGPTSRSDAGMPTETGHFQALCCAPCGTRTRPTG